MLRHLYAMIAKSQHRIRSLTFLAEFGCKIGEIGRWISAKAGSSDSFIETRPERAGPARLERRWVCVVAQRVATAQVDMETK